MSDRIELKGAGGNTLSVGAGENEEFEFWVSYDLHKAVFLPSEEVKRLVNFILMRLKTTTDEEVKP